MKRFLSLVLSLAMILPIMLAATPALAEGNPYAEHLTFKVFTSTARTTCSTGRW